MRNYWLSGNIVLTYRGNIVTTPAPTLEVSLGATEAVVVAFPLPTAPLCCLCPTPVLLPVALHPLSPGGETKRSQRKTQSVSLL